MFLVCLVLLVVILIVVIRFLVGQFLVKKQKKSDVSCYSWIDVLNPFNLEPFRLYRHLSSDNKGAFWSLTASFLVAIITFWAGLTLPLYINEKSQQSTDRLARYMIIDKFYPKYSEYVDSCSEVLNVLNYSLIESFSEEKLASNRLYAYITSPKNHITIANTAEQSFEYYSQILPYVYSEGVADSIRTNNYYLLLGYKCMADSTAELPDSSIYVRNLVAECSSLGDKIGYNRNVVNIASKFYSLAKAKRALNDKYKKQLEAIMLKHLILMPMLKNKMLIEQEFFFPSEKDPVAKIYDDVRVKALLLLILCIFVGYVLFRIVLMRVLDRNSLTPNPLLSQSDLDNLMKEIKSLKIELSLMENEESKRHDC